MQIANSPPILAAARQSAEQIAPARDANETKYPAPKAPRVRVQIRERQGFVEAPQGLVHDRALRLDGSLLLSRCHGQHHPLCAPLDIDVADERGPKNFGGGGFRAP